MTGERDRARAEVARRGLTSAAVELIARDAFARLPISLIDRARAQLRRFFEGDAWRVDDDAALAALVGPGSGWTDRHLDHGIELAWGWRAGAFRVDVALAEEAAPDVTPVAGGRPPITVPGVAERTARTLGDTFDAPLVVEHDRTPATLCFLTGPGMIGNLPLSRADPGHDPRVRALFDAFADIETIKPGPGTLRVTLVDGERWPNVLHDLFGAIGSAFVAPRPPVTDRQLDRAYAEMGALDPREARDLAKILDACSSPDAAARRVAVARLAHAETIAATRQWELALDDPSRSVRRAAARAMAHADAPPPRAPLERALTDADPCVRYYALRGLARIGVGTSVAAVDACRADNDPRVRIAADAVANGRTPV